MEKRLSFQFLLLLLLSLALFLSACGSNQNSFSAKGDDGAETVGIALPSASLERWNRDGDYMKAQFLGAGYGVELRYSDNDGTRQDQDIRELIGSGVSLLLVAAVDREALAGAMREAEKAGIPVIAYDRLLTGSGAVDYYVSFDNYAVGTLQGQYLIEALGLENGQGPIRMELVAGDPADHNAEVFFNGAFDTLRPYLETGQILIPSGREEFSQVAITGWSSEGAKAYMQEVLDTYYTDGGALDAVLCSNDSLALGVAEAVVAASDAWGGTLPLITGQDGDIANLRNIVDGIQSMRVYKDISDESNVAFELARAVLERETPDASIMPFLGVRTVYDDSTYDNGEDKIHSFLLIPRVVDKDSLQELVDTGNYRWDSSGKYLETNG